MRTSKNMRGRRIRLYGSIKRSLGVVACYCCGGPVSWKQATLEHIIPVAMGGTSDKSNLAISHKVCNHSRGRSMERDMRSGR